MELRLLQYSYKYDCQGTDEEGTDYALVEVPVGASFEIARSLLLNVKYHNQCRITIDSVVDKTIHWYKWRV